MSLSVLNVHSNESYLEADLMKSHPQLDLFQLVVAEQVVSIITLKQKLQSIVCTSLNLRSGSEKKD